MKRCPNCRASYPDQAVFCPADGAPLASEAQADPFVGRVLDGKYQIEAALGEGGMGKVYRARHAMLDRAVAVKVLHEAMRVDGRTAERFRREAQAAARLEHPNAVTIHDFGVTPEGNAYLVMELVKGISLRDMLIRRGRLPLDRAVDVIEQVGAAVDRAHQAGIVHRDLKPDNIMIEERADGAWVAKVLDFGIAKLKDRAEAPSNLTATGTVLGTVAYMSPEQCRGTEIDGRSDIYSLGIVLYEMVTGRVPFSSATPSAIVAGHVSDTPPPPSAYQPDLPPAIEQVILAALAKRPEDWPSTAAEFARRFRNAATGQGDHAATVAIRGATAPAAGGGETVPVFAGAREHPTTVDARAPGPGHMAPPIATTSAPTSTHTIGEMERPAALWPWGTATVVAM
jgi:eukaryotic-like serine/threonine-protein kinase